MSACWGPGPQVNTFCKSLFLHYSIYQTCEANGGLTVCWLPEQSAMSSALGFWSFNISLSLTPSLSQRFIYHYGCHLYNADDSVQCRRDTGFKEDFVKKQGAQVRNPRLASRSCTRLWVLSCTTVVYCLLCKNKEAGEMAQWLRALTPVPKVLSSNPSNHMVAHNHQ